MIRSNRNTRQSRAKQRGQALVEGALIMIAVLAMILFVLDMGRILLMGQFVTERARLTARMAVVNNWDQQDVQSYFAYNKKNPPLEYYWNGAGYLGLRPWNVSYSLLGTQRDGDLRVQVKVSNIDAVMFVPYMAGKYKFPAVTVEMAAQSLGATN